MIGNTDAKAERKVYGGYGEIIWPLLHGVTLQTAGRVEDYTDIQRAAFSPSAGLTVVSCRYRGTRERAGRFPQAGVQGHR